jgi:hypothetical protein
VGTCYPNLGGVFLTLDAPNGLFLHVSVTNQQIKLAGKAAEMTKSLQKISVSGNQKFKYKTNSKYICF